MDPRPPFAETTTPPERSASHLLAWSPEPAPGDPRHVAGPVGPVGGVGAVGESGEWWADHTRVARPRDRFDDLSPDRTPLDRPPLDRLLPVPGRHAARRDAERLPARAAELVPAPLRGRVALGLPQLAVVVVILALGLVVTGWWLVRSNADSVQAPPTLEGSTGPDLVALSPVAATSAPSAPSPQASSAASPTPGVATAGDTGETGETGETVTVDVAGAVRRPGVAVLPVGSRVADALESAGGAREGVDLSTINLARVVVDGEQILVGQQAAPVGVVPSAGAPVPPAASTGVPVAAVDLNTADQATLETLPEVGPVTALAILAWRDEHGTFTAVEELLEVDGIGEVTLSQIAPHVTV